MNSADPRLPKDKVQLLDREGQGGRAGAVVEAMALVIAVTILVIGDVNSSICTNLISSVSSICSHRIASSNVA